MFHTKVVDKIKTHILRSIIIFLENRAFYGIMWKNVVQPENATRDIKVQYMPFGCWITVLQTRAPTHIICNTYLFSTATVVTRTLCVHCPADGLVSIFVMYWRS